MMDLGSVPGIPAEILGSRTFVSSHHIVSNTMILTQVSTSNVDIHDKN